MAVDLVEEVKLEMPDKLDVEIIDIMKDREKAH